MASAVGIAVLDAIKEDKLQENCANLGTYFIQELAKLRQEYKVSSTWLEFKGLIICLPLSVTV